jgi:hypothetical protein
VTVAIEPWGACWPAGQEALIVADVAAQDPRILLAVHQPMAMQRVPVPLPGQRPSRVSEPDSTEHDLLRLLLEGQSPEGTLLVPIIGAPGTGKSHLVRWLAAAVPKREDLVIRHIPRERTSLPRVVEILFEGSEGPAFDELRKALEGTRADRGKLGVGDELEQVATRLVFRIAELVQFGLGTPWRRAAGLEDDVRHALCDATVLPALLTDAVARDRLTRKGGAVYRLAHDIVEGHDAAAAEEDEELGFREEDLDFPNARGFGPMAARALLNLRLSGYKDAALAILSDALDVAAADVIGLGSISLADLFERFRAALFQEGKELVLLFEDIAIARGLQLDLIDALTTPAVRDGTQKLCTLRIALALTSTYWDEQAPETLSTRAHAWGAEMFDLDVPAKTAEDRAPDLIGRYMNAARLGLRPGSGDDIADVDGEPPNVCNDCPLNVKDECHRLFGTSASGHGLYPLTVFAAKTLPPLADEQVRPRLVLSDVVAPVLSEHNSLAPPRFPASDDLRDLVTSGVEMKRLTELSISQIERLEDANLGPDERDRAETLLRAWLPGSRPEVLSVFGLSRELLATDGKPPRKSDSQKPDGDKAPPTPRQEDSARQEIEAWAAGQHSLSIGLGRTLRGSIWSELRTGIRWNELALSRSSALALLGIGGPPAQQQNAAVRIENAGGGGALGRTTDPLIVLVPNGPNARLLLAFLELSRRSQMSDVSPDDLARIHNFVAACEKPIAERIREGFSPQFVIDAGKLLSFAAAALVDELEIDGTPSFDTALVVPDAEGATPPRGKAWNEFRAEAREEHRRLVGVLRALLTRSQGEAAAPTAIDAALLDRNAIDRDPGGLARALRTQQLKQRHEALRQLAEAALEHEAQATRDIRDDIATLAGQSERLALETLRAELDGALDLAQEAAVLRGDVQRLREWSLPSAADAAAAFGTADVTIRAAERGLSMDSLARLARTDTAMLENVRGFLQQADAILEASTEAAAEAIRMRSGSGSRNGVGIEVGAIEQILHHCEALQ